MKEPATEPPLSTAAPQPSIVRAHSSLSIGLLFVVLILLALITLPPLTNARAEALRIHLNTDVQAFADTLTATENDLQQMQAATRGYILTRAPAFLEQYRAAQDRLPANIQHLKELGPRVDPAMESQVAELALVVERWQHEAGDRQIALIQQGRAAEAIEEVSDGNSQALFDSFRDRVNDLQEQTQATTVALLEQINRARTLQVALTSGLGALGLLAGGFVIFGFRRMLLLMRELAAAREQAAALADQARTERRRLQAVFDHSPEGIVFAEAPRGRIVLANRAAVALIGPEWSGMIPDQHPLIGRVYWPGGAPCAIDDLPLVRSLKHGEERGGVELIVEQPDGQRVPVLVTSVPLHAEDGTLQGAVAVFQDLRQLHEVERLKSDFVALVSHELRTPLTAIQGCVQTLLTDGDSSPARTREFLQIIAEQSERLQELIDNLLNLSQLEAGVLRLRRELVQPQQLIRGVLRQLRERLGGLRVQMDIAPALPAVSADPRRMEQVLFNLLDNARKFSPPGGAITISAACSGKNEVTICVRDQGPGIPAAERERVFERFYQGEQPATRSVGGTGLGLAICKALVEAHDGRIWIDAAPGGGAAVCFSLPAMPATEPAEMAPGPRVLAHQQSDKTRVLVVDDDPALRRLVEAGLSDAGYEVETVVEPQAALEAALQQAPDIILLDLMLPGMDGFALCEQLREWTDVPIIMLTARAAEKDVVLGLRLGADDYVTKPFHMNELIARIEAVLRRSQTDGNAAGPSLIEVGDLAIDLAQRRVTVDGAVVNLTPTEYRILAYLARHAGQVLTHEQILQEVWGSEYSGENNYLWVHIAHLRQKIEPQGEQPRYILTERGVGYRLAKQP